MSKLPFYVIGNWKSNKTMDEAVIWMRDFETFYKKTPFDVTKVQAVICAPFLHVTTLSSLLTLSNIPLKLGVQTISSFAVGAYTGEVAASMIAGLAHFVLIGHSERRKHFKETDEELAQKVKQAKSVGLEVVYCVQDENMTVPDGVNFVGYEPVWAIGTGKAETAENANTVAVNIKKRLGREVTVIYGGSVTPENIGTYVTMQHLGGVLPGGASLKADTFHSLLTHAAESVT